jgi:hypothetical protein
MYMYMCIYIYIYADMPDSQYQSGIGMKKTKMPEQVRYRTNLQQAGIFLALYRTGIIDAEMPMPALFSLMPMPSYARYRQIRK